MKKLLLLCVLLYGLISCKFEKKTIKRVLNGCYYKSMNPFFSSINTDDLFPKYYTYCDVPPKETKEYIAEPVYLGSKSAFFTLIRREFRYLNIPTKIGNSFEITFFFDTDSSGNVILDSSLGYTKEENIFVKKVESILSKIKFVPAYDTDIYGNKLNPIKWGCLIHINLPRFKYYNQQINNNNPISYTGFSFSIPD